MQRAAREGIEVLDEELEIVWPDGTIVHELGRATRGTDALTLEIGERLHRLAAGERLAQPDQPNALPGALLDDRPQPGRTLVPPVPKELGVKRTDDQRGAAGTRAGAASEAGG